MRPGLQRQAVKISTHLEYGLECSWKGRISPVYVSYLASAVLTGIRRWQEEEEVQKVSLRESDDPFRSAKDRVCLRKKHHNNPTHMQQFHAVNNTRNGAHS